MTESQTIGLLPRAALHDLCAGAKGDNGSPGNTWSACIGSSARGSPPQIQQ